MVIWPRRENGPDTNRISGPMGGPLQAMEKILVQRR
jgi:hypothetical protein